MKRRLSITAVIIMMNQVLTPFSYAFAETGDILNLEENNVAVEEIVEEEPVEDDIEDVEEQNIEDLSDEFENNGDDSQEGDKSIQSWSEEDPLDGNGEGLTGDVQRLTGDVFTGSTEELTGDILTGDIVEVNMGIVLTGDVQRLTGDVLTGDVFTGDQVQEIDYSQYTKETRVAVLANKLGINWEEDAQYYAILAGIEDKYFGTAEQNEKIRLFLLDNLEGILNGDFDEIIAEMKENPDSNPLEGTTGDVEILTGNVLTGDILTGSAIDALKENLEEIEILRDEELVRIWENLNETKIVGQEMYKDVIVNVEAPVGSFPSVAELRITPITTQSEQQQIKDQLVENTDVTEESELVSFDISFVYTLSGGEVVELQPAEGKTVKVSFNYTYNDTLSEADNDDNKELKVYHIEEVVNEKGRKTDEVEIKEVEINKSESSNGEVVIDADKFSVYTIVDQRLAETNNVSGWTLGVDYQYIVVRNPNDSTNAIVIMDRNLGATSTSDGGYHYQRGNNYGFSESWAQSHYNQNQVNVSNVDPSEYYSSTFVAQAGGSASWMTSFNSNIWGGGSDTSTNDYGEGQTNYTDRQGPCPDGWHVPSLYEWNTLVTYWNQSKGYGNTTQVSSANWSTFQSDFNIVNNGYLRSSSAGSRPAIESSSNTYLYTSSPGSSSAGYRMRGKTSDGFRSSTSSATSDGLGIRCFKNPESYLIQFVNYDGTVLQSGTFSRGLTPSYNGTTPTKPNSGDYRYTFNGWTPEIGVVVGAQVYTATYISGDILGEHTVTFYDNDGVTVLGTGLVADGDKITKPTDPTKADQLFKYWTTDVAGNNQYDFNTPVTSDLILYAQWGGICTVTFQNGYCYRGNNNNGKTLCNFSLTTTSVNVACGTPVRRPKDPSSWTDSNNRTYYIGRWVQGTQDPGYGSSSNYNFSTPVTSNITLYAIGFRNSNNAYYTVTFDVNGGTLTDSATANVGYYNNNSYSYVREPDDPTRVGYTFRFWTNTPNGNTAFNFNTTRIQDNTTLYAQWTPHTYTIRYNANGGVGNMADTDMTYDIAKNLSSNTFTKANATFSGWNTKADKSGRWYSSGESVNNLTTTEGDVINLYAIWTCNDHYHEEGGACVKDKFEITWLNRSGQFLTSGLVEYDVVPTYNGTPTRDSDAQYNYQFSGWNPTPVAVTTNATYTAVYTPVIRIYTATIQPNNSLYGSVSPTSVTGVYNTNIIGSNNILTIGTTPVVATAEISTDSVTYRFVGWDTSSCGNNGTKLIGDCTITANFEQLANHTVTFDANRGTIVEPQRVAHGYTATQPTTTFPGYTFGGWYTNTGLTNLFNFSTPITSDITLYAKWTYNLAFNDLNVYFVKSNGSVSYNVIMDRNLGATELYNNNYDNQNVASYGYYYQWGNNYGFPTTGSVSTTSISVPREVWSQYIPSKYARAVFVLGQNSWMEGITTTDNVWGWNNGTNLDRQGPCPDGYHVPTNTELHNMVVDWDSASVIKGFEQFASDFLLPSAGQRNNLTSNPDFYGTISYWTTTRRTYGGGNMNVFKLFSISPGSEAGNSHKSSSSIRCFRNTKTLTMTIDPKGGTGAVIAFTGTVNNGKITTLGNPTKANATFQGWYSNSALTNQVVTGSTAPANLYAKWQCNTNYHEDNNGDCVLNTYTVTFDANRGTITESQEVGYGQTVTNPGTTFPGYTLDGWYISGTDTLFDLSTPITGDLDLYAKWTYNLTFNDLNVYFVESDGSVEHSILMDRNLGATSNDVGSTASYGYYYQWGNNYGFPTQGSVPTSSTQVDASGYGPGNYYNSDTFIIGSNDWSSVQNDNLRGGSGSVLDKQGPCPDGYHIPNISEWGNVLDYWNNANTEVTNIGTQISSDLLVPIAGYRNSSTATIVNMSMAMYWSASPNSSDEAYLFYLIGNRVRTNESLGRGYGNTVRCFKNTQTSTMTVYPKGGTGAIIAFTGKIITLGSPTKANATFQGWYSNSTYTNQVVVGSTAPASLYAKWQCNTGYEEDSNGNCVLKKYTVTFDANRGTITAPQEVGHGQTITNPDTTFPGYTLDGWYISGTNTLFDLSTPITGDLDLYAKWTYNLTFNDLNVYFVESDGSIEHSIIMDRNLGATEAYNQNSSNQNTGSYGYHYQRGNNYGFGRGDVSKKTGLVSESIWSQYVPSKYASGIFVRHRTNWMGGASITDNIWGGNGSVIDRQGPCPDGYHVPTITEWGDVYNYWNNTNKSTDSLGKQWASDLLLPFAGARNYNTANIIEAGGRTYYWSSTPDSSEADRAYYLGFYQNSIFIETPYRTNGESVRCFKNTQPDTMTINPNGGTGAVIAFTGTVNNGKITTLGSPSKANATFQGWYSNYSNGTYSNQIVTGSTAPANLYAKWQCNTGYHNEDDVCVLNTYTVTINRNNTSYGTVSAASVTGSHGGEIIISGNTVKIGGTTVTATATPSELTDQYTYEFSGWNSTCGDTLTGDCTITAEFNRLNNYTVTFDANRGTIVEPQRVAHGYTATQPTTEFPGYTFGGWYTNTGLTNSFNFSIPITSDITLYAKWTYNLAFNDLNVYFVESDGSVNYSVIMDRNLGATEVYNQNYDNPNRASYGYHYQWGNNYGFPNEGTMPRNNTSVPKSLRSQYVPSKYASGLYVTNMDTWMGGSANGDNIWGGANGSVIDKQGPCPDGYHVPNRGERNSIFNNWGNAKTVTSNIGTQRASDLFMPFAGRHTTFGDPQDHDYNGRYRSTLPNSSSYAYSFWFSLSNIGIQNTTPRSNALSVRCFKNTQTATMTINPNGGTGAVIAFTGTVNNGKIVTLGSPTKANATFKGWYKESTYNTQVHTGDTAPASLYAKWQCNTNYHEENGVCVLDYFNVTINVAPDGYGTVDSGTVVADYNTPISTSGNTVTIGSKTITATESGATQQYTYVFSGWINNCGEYVTTGCTIIAQFRAILNKYYVTFNSNGGNYTPNSQNIEYGSNATEPTPAPTKTGYNFGAWTLNSSDFNFNTPITGAITLVARWNLIHYNIIYMDGSETMSLEPSTYTIEDSVVLPEPTKAGYTFSGWLENGNKITSIPTGTYGNKTLNATWTEREDTAYRINYYTHNLGATTYSLNSYVELTGRTNATLQVSDYVKFITGHTFEAAYLNGGTTKPSAGAVTSTTILPDGSRVINLYYRPNHLYTRLNVNGGVMASDHGAGYTISGEFIKYNNSIDLIRGVYGGKVGAVTLSTYAVSTQGLYDYNYNGAVNLVKTGYAAPSGSEWNTQADGNGTSYSQSSSSYYAQGFAGADLTNGDASVTLYVNWKPNSYNISYVLNSGAYGEYHPDTATYDTAFTVTNPTRTGYTFNGWKITGMLNGDTHYYGSETTTATTIESTKATSFKNLHATTNNIVTFTAQWTVNEYTIIYNLNGGSVNPANPTSYTVESADITLNNPTKTGYTFLGWTGSNGSVAQTGVTIPSGSVGNKSYNAVWSLNTYTITYNLNGGSVSQANPTSYTIESADITLNNPTKTGYTFLGWTGSNGSVAQTGVTIPSGSVGNKSYNATWTERNDTRYVVNYFVHDLGVTTYSVDSYAQLSGTTNATIYVSDLIIPIAGHTFEAAYITGNETKPSDGEITSTTILPDGSRVINLYYTPNLLYVRYHMNGGSLAAAHGSDYGVSGDYVTYSGSINHLRGIYGGRIGKVFLDTYTAAGESGLHNYNNSNGINVTRTGYTVVNDNNVWNTQADGNGTPYSQTVQTYSAQGFAGADMTNGDVTVTLYLNWTPIEYTITYNMNGGINNANNPTKYTIESGNITLQQPTRTGYTFKGWTGSNGSTAQTAVTIAHGSVGGRTYNAVWEAKNVGFTVCYYKQNLDANNNIVLNTYIEDICLEKDGYADDEITLLDYVTALNGFTYNHGEVNGQTVTTTTVSPDGHTEIYLYYNRNKYNYTLNSSTGATTAGSSLSGQYYYQAKVTLKGDSNDDCYTWSRWNASGVTISSSTSKNTSFTMPANDVTVTPVVNEKTYNIVFNGNNNTSGSMTNINGVRCSQSIQLPANGFGRAGYTFSGWSTTAGGVKAYDDQQTVSRLSTTSGATVTLFARWVANTNTPYVVNHWYLDLNDQRDNSNKQTENKVGTTDTNVTPAFIPKDGFNNPTAQITTGIKGDGTTVINYEYPRKEITLTFNGNQGTPASTTKTGKFGANVGEVTQPSRDGYTFGGWNPTVPGTFPSANATYVAQWDIVTYNIDYELYGGTNDPRNPETYTVETPTFTIYEATRTGYTFLGWTGSNGTSPQQTIELTQGNYGYKHYFANWSLDTYTITYNMDGGTNSVSNPSSYTYEDATITLADPTKTGYIFEGWIGEGVTTPTKGVQIENHSTGSKEYTAVWLLDTYGIFYQLDGGINNPANPSKYTYESGAITLQDPTKTGYTFLGWTGEGTTTPTKGVKIPAHSTGNKTYNAVWDANIYNIKYILNTGAFVGQHPNTATYDVQFTVNNPSRTGYTFSGWKITGMDEGVKHYYGENDTTANSIARTKETLFKNLTSISGGTVNFEALWDANTGTKYEVIHIYTGTNDGIGSEVVTGVHYGTSDTTVVAQLAPRSGFVTPTEKNIYIKPDGTARVTYVYEREEYTLSYNSNLGTEVNSTTIKYDAKNDRSPRPTRTGYTFVEWSGLERMPIGGTTLEAVWTANTGTTYYVYHYRENVAGTGYDLFETEELSGTTDTLVTPDRKDYDGFTAPDGVEINIDPDGNASVTYQYLRNSYDIIYNVDGGVPLDNQTVRFEDVPGERTTTKTGYTFMGWSDLPSIMPAHNVNVTALWDANTGTEYRVIHIYTGTNDGITGEVVEIIWHGTSDSYVTGALAPRDGFINPEESQIYINSDGNASMIYVYERQEYTLSYNSNGGTPVSNTSIKYGALNDKSPRPTKIGYTFISWSGLDRMPLDGTTLVAQWTANTGTEYHVEHYKQNIDGTYPSSPSQTDILYGTSDVEIIPDVYSYEGFASPSTQTVTINPDGTLVVRYEYTRNSYDVTYDENGGTPVSDTSVKYEDIIPTPATTRTGYAFSGWINMPFDRKMPAGELNLVADWTANTGTTYKVYHYQENIAGTGYDLIETEVLSGTTDTSVTPARKTYEGFTSPAGEAINIDPDGNASVSYYYSRNSYNLKIRDRDDVLVNEDVKYGDIIDLPEEPTWTGHTFIRWSGMPEDGKMPANPVEIVAVWDTNIYTITFDVDGGTEIEAITGNYGDVITAPATPTRDGYRFVRWEPEIPETMPDHDITIKAVWEKIEENEKGGRSGGGGHGGAGAGDEHGSADDQPQGGSDISNVDPEVLAAYQRAYKNGVTTIEGFENANPDGLIPRGHMAKMVTNFAVNVLGREIPSEIPAECSWGDTDWESEEIKDYAVKSCALGVMGIYMEDFLPNKILDRAELGTIISRLLWGDTYNVIDTNNRPYYVEHLKELKSEGIMAQIQNPEARKELRKWAWLMLMRVQQNEDI